MKTIKIIFFYFFFGLSFVIVRGQQIGNYVNNGSFEEFRSVCLPPGFQPALKYWSAIDTTKNGFGTLNIICGNVPISGSGYQWPRTGKGFVKASSYIQNSNRGYFRNQLKGNLIANRTYCIRFYINVINLSPYAIDAYGAYFGDNSLDTITNPYQPKTYLTPQFENPIGNFISDTLNWIALSGTFTANGTEKFLVIGNFKDQANVGVIPILQPPSTYVWCDINLDDVSVMEVNLAAYAGTDKLINVGDSVFIGRQPDFATDTACIWYKLPNSITSIDTISGLWVSPSVTSTYVVRQELDCSSVKWDTVVVTINTNLVGLDKLQKLSDNINLFPNPTSGNLSISAFIGSDNTTFSISNCLGQNVLNGDIIQKNNLIIIETSELESGLYQIHLKTQYGIVTKKFVKTN